jgi:hypothetical protein
MKGFTKNDGKQKPICLPASVTNLLAFQCLPSGVYSQFPSLSGSIAGVSASQLLQQQ